MTLPLSHWRRETIATGMNDIQYQLHGTKLALTVLQRSGVTLEQAGGLRFLDFGCGTGRVARAVALMAKNVAAYDPSQRVIDAARIECPPWPTMMLTNLEYTNRLDAVPDGSFDVVYSVNVVEHLGDTGAIQAFEQMRQKVKPRGVIVVWLKGKNNPRLAKMLGTDLVGHDIGVFGMQPPVAPLTVDAKTVASMDHVISTMSVVRDNPQLAVDIRRSVVDPILRYGHDTSPADIEQAILRALRGRV
jgi:SAM-dependent methyltransferase